MRGRAALVVWAALIFACAAPQRPIQAPPPPPPAALKLPEITRFRLANGLEVIAVPRHELPLASFGVAVKAGGYDEQRGTLGVAAFTAEMLRRGTATRTADEIADAIDRAGGRLETSGGDEASTVSCSVLSRDTALCLDLIADLLQHPTFPEAEMAEVRDQMLGAIRRRYDEPGALAQAHFDHLVFGDQHPDGWIPMPEDVERLRRADLVRFWQAHYRPNRSLLVVAGDVDPARLQAEVERRLAAWPSGDAPARPAFSVPERHGTRVLLVDKEDLTQASLVFGHAGIRHGDPDWYAATMVNYVLGGSDFSSRLMTEVRARRGLTYGIRSSFGASLYTGAFRVTAATRNETVGAALEASIQEVRKMAAAGPGAEELAKARGFYAGSHPFSLQSASELADGIVTAELHGLGIDYVRDLVLRLAAVDVEQARATARARLHPDDLVVVVVGRASVVAPQLQAAGYRFDRIGYRDPISAPPRPR